MKKNINKSAIIVSLVLLLAGVLMVVFDNVLIRTNAYVVSGVGCSVIASGLVLILTSLFLDFKKSYEVWDNWKLEKIFHTRAEKNVESDPMLESHRIHNLDGIAFGLKSFRSTREKDILFCLHNGMQMRLLVMNPDSDFIRQREQEENEEIGSISKSIKDLISWAEKLNKLSNKGKINIRLYNTMTLDFYWRIDNVIYIGPYLLNTQSQQTITYKFIKGGLGYDYYYDYFDSLWNDDKFCNDINM